MDNLAEFVSQEWGCTLRSWLNFWQLVQSRIQDDSWLKSCVEDRMDVAEPCFNSCAPIETSNVTAKISLGHYSYLDHIVLVALEVLVWWNYLMNCKHDRYAHQRSLWIVIVVARSFKLPPSIGLLIEDEKGRNTSERITIEYLCIPPKCDFCQGYGHYNADCMWWSKCLPYHQ